MKNAIILALFVAVMWLAFGRFDGPQPAIEDTMLHRADAPLWKPGSAADEMLFAPCPLEPRVLHKWLERTA